MRARTTLQLVTFLRGVMCSPNASCEVLSKLNHRLHAVDLGGCCRYQLDVFFDHFTGHMSRGDPGPLVGAFYIKKLIERCVFIAQQ